METEAHKKWMGENTIRISLRLQKRTDADIIECLEGKAEQTEIKRLIRLGIEKEKENQK